MLTDRQCKNASCVIGKPRVRLADAGGLYLEVSAAGSKRWFWKFRFDGKEKQLALGRYPDLGLREARDDARKQQQRGADPVVERQVQKLSARFDAEASFEVVSRAFHETKKHSWSDQYAKRWLERLAKDMFPWPGKLPLSQIGAPALLQTLRRVENRGARELPHSLLEACGQVFRYGIATGRCERSPAADLRGALKPVMTRHMSAIVEPDEARNKRIGQFVRWLCHRLFVTPLVTLRRMLRRSGDLAVECLRFSSAFASSWANTSAATAASCATRR